MPTPHTPTHTPSSTRLPPSLRFYIHRTPSNAIVPLIPADQLPFSLRDFPRHLSHVELSGGGWVFVGETGAVAWPLVLGGVEGDVDVVGVREGGGMEGGLARDEEMEVEKEKEKASSYQVPNPQTRAHVASSTAPTVAKSIPASLTDSMAAIYTKDARRVGYMRPLSSSSLSPRSPTSAKRSAREREKEHCRHWIRTGACKWTATKEGCRYTHAMPSQEKLAEIGIAGVPRWFGERGVSGGKDGVSGFDGERERTEAARRSGGEKDKGMGTGACGVYTTDTAGEPMLMDLHVDGASCGVPTVADTPPTVSTPQRSTAHISKTASAICKHVPIQGDDTVYAIPKDAASKNSPSPTPSSNAPPNAKPAPTLLEKNTVPAAISTNPDIPPPPSAAATTPSPASLHPRLVKTTEARKSSCTHQVKKPRAVAAGKEAASNREEEDGVKLERMFTRKGVVKQGCKVRVWQEGVVRGAKRGVKGGEKGMQGAGSVGAEV